MTARQDIYSPKFFDSFDIEPSKLVILAGAGISINAPSCLPSGIALTNFYLDMAFGTDALTECVLKRWNNISLQVEKATGVQVPFMRLESIIEKVNDVDREFGYKPLMKGYELFAEIEPNSLHYQIKNLMQMGAKLITPNFDYGVERAFDRNFGIDNKPMYDDELGMYVSTVGDCNIYHYHGIAGDFNGLGATIAKIRNGFSKEFESLLKSWFEDGCVFLTVGFSYSDFFDMSQFLQGLEPGIYGNAIAFNHAIKKEEAEWFSNIQNKKTVERQRTDLASFSSCIVLCGDTEKFLCDMVKSVCENEDSEADIVKISDKSEVEVWKKSFLELKTTQREHSFYMVHLFNQFGYFPINEDIRYVREKCQQKKQDDIFNDYSSFVSYVDDAAKCFFDYFGDKEDLYAHFMDITKVPDMTKTVAYDFKMICRDMDVTLESVKKVVAVYNRAANDRKQQRSKNGGFVKETLDRNITIEDIYKEIEKCESEQTHKFPSEYIQAFNVMCTNAIGLKLKDGNMDDNEIRSLCGCAEKIISLRSTQFLFVSHELSIMKKYDRLCVLCNEDNKLLQIENYIRKALEICYTDEVIRIYGHDMLIKLLQLIKICSHNDTREYYETLGITERTLYSDIKNRKRDLTMYVKALSVPGGLKDKSKLILGTNVTVLTIKMRLIGLAKYMMRMMLRF